MVEGIHPPAGEGGGGCSTLYTVGVALASCTALICASELPSPLATGGRTAGSTSSGGALQGVAGPNAWSRFVSSACCL